MGVGTRGTLAIWLAMTMVPRGVAAPVEARGHVLLRSPAAGEAPVGAMRGLLREGTDPSTGDARFVAVTTARDRTRAAAAAELVFFALRPGTSRARLSRRVPLSGEGAAGLDPVSLSRSSDGTYWFAERSGPSLVHADAAGKILRRFLAGKTPGLPLPCASGAVALEATAYRDGYVHVLARQTRPRGGETVSARAVLAFDVESEAVDSVQAIAPGGAVGGATAFGPSLLLLSVGAPDTGMLSLVTTPLGPKLRRRGGCYEERAEGRGAPAPMPAAFLELAGPGPGVASPFALVDETTLVVASDGAGVPSLELYPIPAARARVARGR